MSRDCTSCPFLCGSHPDADYANNMGCLPDAWRVVEMKVKENKNWACHSHPERICKGLVEHSKEKNLGLDFKTGVLYRDYTHGAEYHEG